MAISEGSGRSRFIGSRDGVHIRNAGVTTTSVHRERIGDGQRPVVPFDHWCQDGRRRREFGFLPAQGNVERGPTIWAAFLLVGGFVR